MASLQDRLDWLVGVEVEVEVVVCGVVLDVVDSSGGQDLLITTEWQDQLYSACLLYR